MSETNEMQRLLRLQWAVIWYLQNTWQHEDGNVAAKEAAEYWRDEMANALKVAA